MSFYDDASLIFLAGAAAGKDGKAYSVKPTDGSGDFTFSRGSNLAATRVGPTGLIEKGRENLLVQSNQFSSTWTGMPRTSGFEGYDGSNDGWKITKSAQPYTSIQQAVSLSGVWTFSVYAKADTLSRIDLRNATDASRAGFDLSTGSLVETSGGIADTNIESLSNDWYRISATFTAAATQVQIYLGWANSTAGSVFIQDSQVEIGLAATDYIESGATTGKAGLLEDEPRFDYSGGATCPSLLLEPSRTNLVEQSEYIDSWSKAGSVTISTNSDISPEGIQNASLILPNAGSGTFGIIDSILKSTSSITYTLSGFAKAKDYNFLILRIDSGASNGVKGAFDLSDGTISTAFTTNGTGFSFIDADIKPYSNNWYRYEVSFTTDSLSLLRAIFYASNVTGNGFSVPSYTANGTDGVLFWGAQIEQGSYPTSYIPNHSGGTITRGEDYCRVTGISSLFGQTEGTLFLELEPMTLNDNPFIALYANSSNYLEVNIGAVAGTQYEMRLSDGTNSTNPRGGTPQANTTFKLAIKVESGNQKTFVDGTEIISSSIALDYSSTPLSILAFNRSNGNNHFYGNVKQTLVFPEALSDADCITLTT